MKETIFAISAAFFLLASCYEGEAGLSAAAQAGGITGRVRAKWIERYQVVVFIQSVPGKRAELRAERQVMNQRDKSFVPRLLPVVVGTTVEFKNSDPFKHNIFSPDGERYNLGTWVEERGKSYTFNRPGVYRQLCNIHPEMLAYIVVHETPYFALTDKDGNFEIGSIPSGKYLLQVWGEKLTKEQLARTFEVIVGEGAPVSIAIDLIQ